jgi:hypothetical protein
MGFTSTKNYDNLNGKLILAHIANRFSIDADYFTREIADKVLKLELIPVKLSNLIPPLNN